MLVKVAVTQEHLDQGISNLNDRLRIDLVGQCCPMALALQAHIPHDLNVGFEFVGVTHPTLGFRMFDLPMVAQQLIRKVTFDCDGIPIEFDLDIPQEYLT